MKTVIFDSATIRSFRSVSGEITIPLSDTGGLCFLSGINLVEPHLGSNGSGKSTLLDAVVWCLYGVSVRGHRASELTPWGTKDRPYVRIELLIDEEPHTIERTGSPDTLVLNGEAVPQGAIDALVGLSRARFLHSVIFGQASPLFMDLSVPERMSLLDEIMPDLGYWLRMSEIATTRAKELTGALHELETNIAHQSGRVEGMMQQLEQLQQAQAQWQGQQAAQIEAARNRYVTADTALRAAEGQARQAREMLAASPDPAEWQDAVVDAQAGLDREVVYTAEEDARREGIKYDIAFLRDHTVCDVCKQPIDASHAAQRIYDLECELESAETGWANHKAAGRAWQEHLANLTAEMEAARVVRGDIQRRIAQTEAEYHAAQQTLVQANNALVELTQNVDPIHEALEQLLSEAEAVEARINEWQAERTELEIEITRVDYWAKRGFRQVRLFLIRRILTIMEVEVARAAAVLGIGNWSITFEVETATRSPGIHVKAVNSLGYGDYRSYSPGEGQRVKLAVSLGMSQLIHSLAGISISIEAWDEPTSWLSPEGIDDLLDCLSQRGETTQKTIWLIDHRSLTFPFEAIYEATKGKEGTTIQKLR